MKSKGVSKTIWIIIVIVIGSIAALLLVQGFKGSWGSLTDSIGGITDSATKTISGLIPDIGFSLPWGGPGGVNAKSCDGIVSELKSKDVSQDKIDKAEQSCEKVKDKWSNIENIVQKVEDSSAEAASKYVSELKEETKASLSSPETIEKLKEAGFVSPEDSDGNGDKPAELDFWLTASLMKTLGINPSIELPEGGEFYFSIEFVDINLKEKSGRIYPQVYWSPNENVRVGGYIDIYVDLPGQFKLPEFKYLGREIPSVPIDLEFDVSDFHIRGGKKYKLKPSVGLTEGTGVHIHWKEGEGFEFKEVNIGLKVSLETERVE